MDDQNAQEIPEERRNQWQIDMEDCAKSILITLGLILKELKEPLSGSG